MDPDKRRSRLNKIFYDILSEKNKLTSYNATLFLEAIAAQPDPATCVNKLIASKSGLSALQVAMQSKLSAQMFNAQVSEVLTYLQAPDLKIINGGAYLNDIVTKIAEPPIFWDAFRGAFLTKSLNEKAQLALGWLLLQLCCLPTAAATPYRDHIDTQSILQMLLCSTSLQIRSIGQNVKHVLDTCKSVSSIDSKLGRGPGGRHDNDLEDFRKISILPTADELESTDLPFIRPCDVLEDPDTEDSRVSIHLDNQFRLLREDMIYEMREELQIVMGKKTAFRQRDKIAGLTIKDIECGADGKRTKWGLVVESMFDLPRLRGIQDTKKRKEYLEDHRNFLKHQSLACLVSGSEIIAFPTIIRDEDRLAKRPPEIVLQLEGGDASQKALRRLRSGKHVVLIPIDTAMFSYEPILQRLQNMNTLPLASELLLWKRGKLVAKVDDPAMPVIEALTDNPQTDLRVLLDTSSSVRLDASQAKSLLAGLTQRVSLLQGPPGTGKSYIGALLAKAIYRHTSQTILVVCYTNHALDDILTGLLNIGIPANDMLRLGGKSTTATEPLTLQNQKRTGTRSRDQWTIIDNLKQSADQLCQKLDRAFRKFMFARVHYSEFMDYLQFEFPDYFQALSIPDNEDGMVQVDNKGREIKYFYLIDRWHRNWDAGAFRSWSMEDPSIQEIWRMTSHERQAQWKQWEETILQEVVDELSSTAAEYNRVLERLFQAQSPDMVNLFRSKRIVGCTTTAAAKYCEDIQAFNPDVLLVEEAGEILESHVLTALGPETSQIVLIGDHKQLRPKVNNYLLTIEKGEGYDLNRSLFERLILKNYPHETLTEQHRMRPEIASLIRHLTYPELVNAPKTLNRPNIMGLQDNIVFIHHDHPEDENTIISDRRDESASSKLNSFEVKMILKFVKYLGQQGYGTEDIVILTPYLAQLHNLRDALKTDNDPILNDLDSFELVRAGLVNAAEAKLTKKGIRLATIDNYQGEESDIVIVSLTRSNSKCDIGFMFSPERLNVLLSRARNGLIIIGNMDTFMNARNKEGKKLWTKLFNLLRDEKHIYEGLPIKCEQHPNKTFIVREPAEFDVACPDGGCDAPCGIQLSCVVHKCPSKCHQIYDHSKMACEEKISSTCPKGHPQSSKCSEGTPKTCYKCNREARLAKQKSEREDEARRRREADQKAHLERMDALQARVAEIQRSRDDARLAAERAAALKQKEADLDELLSNDSTGQMQIIHLPDNTQPTFDHPHSMPTPLQNPLPGATCSIIDESDSPQSANATASIAIEPAIASVDSTMNQTTPPISNFIPKRLFPQLPVSPSTLEWNRQKLINGITNTSVDAIMNMTGLEDVKKRVLQIIAKIDAAVRQNTSLAQERFNAVLLGNPGTGKTTIARLYAGFLASMKVTPGNVFTETTGARLAHEGIKGAQKLVEDAIKSGGGTIFIDEAYQLTSGDNYGGGAVLDFLLAEMENNIGTLVFILAGYNKEMEKFFEHNPGLNSRVPHQFTFADYKDEELMSMFDNLVKKIFGGRMKLEDGTQGLYSRIVIRRLARRRGHSGFGNARDLQITLDRIRGRQAERLDKVRKGGQRPDDFFMTKEDLIGPDPSMVIGHSQAWEKLQALIGLTAVKQSVRSLFNLIKENYERELIEKEPMDISLNRVFLGSPGTGKTTVAKLYGQILADLGMLSNGEVVVKSPSDFIGAVLGESEKNTKAILSNTIGKVLIIDEAYMLYKGAGSDSSGGASNQFKTTVIDTLVAEIQSVPGEDRCVLMLGYTDEMTEMFQNVNPGLSRRFRIEDAFNFVDFSDVELSAILDLKLKDQDLGATLPAKHTALKLLARMRNRPNFGNAGDVENVISQAKVRCITRRAAEPVSQRGVDVIFESEDFDPDYRRVQSASMNLDKIFEDIVGRDDIIAKLRNFQEVAQACKERSLDPGEQIPTNFVFSGPPGTGKTTIARKLGQVFYDMELLSSVEVIECSASDLVGQYVGQTGPKTKKLFEKALGKVLFVDEAYRLSQGLFAQEAIDELVGLITHPKFKAKLVVILAGYEDDMNHLMTVNSGLSSRFPEQIIFENMDAEYCLAVVRKELKKKNIEVDGLADSSSALYAEMTELVRDLSELRHWGNARDMVTFAKELTNLALLKGTSTHSGLLLSDDAALHVLENMLAERRRKSSTSTKPRQNSELPQQTYTSDPTVPPPTSAPDTEASPATSSNTQDVSRASASNSSWVTHPGSQGRGNARGGFRGRGRFPVGNARRNSPQNRPQPQANQQDVAERDPGVSDALWRQLSEAQLLAIEVEREAIDTINSLQRKMESEQKKEGAKEKELVALEKAEGQEQDADRRSELQRQREEARIKAHEARVAKEKTAADLQAKKEAEKMRKEQEERVQRKLREMGVCIAGFRWIRMDTVYRCTGGSHVVSVDELGL